MARGICVRTYALDERCRYVGVRKRVSGKSLSGGQGKFRERADRGETEKGGHPMNGHPVERVRHGWRTLVLQAKQESSAQQVRPGA